MSDHPPDSLATLFLLNGGLCPVGSTIGREKVSGKRRYKAVTLSELVTTPTFIRS